MQTRVPVVTELLNAALLLSDKTPVFGKDSLVPSALKLIFTQYQVWMSGCMFATVTRLLQFKAFFLGTSVVMSFLWLMIKLGCFIVRQITMDLQMDGTTGPGRAHNKKGGHRD